MKTEHEVRVRNVMFSFELFLSTNQSACSRFVLSMAKKF